MSPALAARKSKTYLKPIVKVGAQFMVCIEASYKDYDCRADDCFVTAVGRVGRVLAPVKEVVPCSERGIDS